MTQISITTNAPLVAKELENLAAEIPEISRGRIFGRAQGIVRRYSKYPPRPGLPIKWDTDKQRIAFFASGGFGGGIPHVRRNAIPGGFKLVKLENGYSVVNDVPGAPFVIGDVYGKGQSRIHQGRWPLLRDVAEQELEQLPQEIMDAIDIAADKKGF